MGRLLILVALLAPGLLACAVPETSSEKAGQPDSSSGSRSPLQPPRGSPSPPPSPASSPSQSPSQSPSPPMSEDSPLPTIKAPTRPPTTPSHVFQPLTVSGTVVQGIYDGCVELVTADNLRYVLVGPQVGTLASGQQVTVRGMPAPHRESRCAGIVLDVFEQLPPR